MKKSTITLLFVLTCLVLLAVAAFATPQTSDADLKAAQASPVVLDGAGFNTSHYISAIPTGLQFTNLELYQDLNGGAGAVTWPTMMIKNSTVTMDNVAGGTDQMGAVFSGHVATVNLLDDGDVASYVVNIATGAQCDELLAPLTQNGSTFTFTSAQTAPIVLWFRTSQTGVTGSVDVTNATNVDFTHGFPGEGTFDYEIGASMTTADSEPWENGLSCTVNGAMPSSQVNALLDAMIVGGDSGGGSMTLGGTSGPPTIVPELDVTTITGPGNGDAFTLVSADSSINFSVSFDNTINLSASTDSSGTIVIGTMDSPAGTDIAAKLAGYFTTDGLPASATSNVITTSDSTFSHWPLTFNATSGSPASFANTQAGIDRVAALTLLGVTITTN